MRFRIHFSRSWGSDNIIARSRGMCKQITVFAASGRAYQICQSAPGLNPKRRWTIRSAALIKKTEVLTRASLST
jgi:hypothetical protein